jgi:hypothetical protein
MHCDGGETGLKTGKHAEASQGDRVDRACRKQIIIGANIVGFYAGWNKTDKKAGSYSQSELRVRWEVQLVASEFLAKFHEPLWPFVDYIYVVFSPPASVGLRFSFVPGKRDTFAALVGEPAAPPKDLQAALNQPMKLGSSPLVPDDPGRGSMDRWWRAAAAGNGIGASFREPGTGTSMHIAIASDQADVHIDRNGFVVSDGGYNHWNLNGLLRHLTVDLAGDKAKWALLSVGYIDKKNRPVIQATLSPWIAVDLPGPDNERGTNVKVGLAITGSFGGRR